MRINIKSQKGAITLMVIITMLFLVSFLMSLYIRVSNKAQTSSEITRQIAEKYARGNGDVIFQEANEVVPISTVEELKLIGTGTSKKINGVVYTFSPTSYYAIQNNLDLEGSNLNQWSPLPLSGSFTGTLDGLGHTITGLYINGNSNYQGLFGTLEGAVKNLNIENCYVKGNNYIGSIAGRNNGTITNCNRTGEFIGNSHVEGKLEIGEYVEYNVTYKDMYVNYEYDNSEEGKYGWRYLGKDDDGNNLIISTGVPVLLNYNSDGSGSSSLWWDSDTSLGASIRAINGLTNNFKDVPFAYSASGVTISTNNSGTYRHINNKTDLTTLEAEITSGVAGATVHPLTLKELNRATNEAENLTGENKRGDNDTTQGYKDLTGTAEGLFNLRQVNGATNASFYLCTNLGNQYLYMVHPNRTDITVTNASTLGLRLVIVIPSNYLLTAL